MRRLQDRTLSIMRITGGVKAATSMSAPISEAQIVRITEAPESSYKRILIQVAEAVMPA